MKAIELMAQEVRKRNTGSDKDQYRVLDIATLLVDQLDRAIVIPNPVPDVAAAASSSSSTTGTVAYGPVPVPIKAPPILKTAYMFTNDDRERNAYAQARVVTYMPELQAMHIRTVDPYADPGVWGIVDDGCNSCCRSHAWRVNATPKWEKKGLRGYLKSIEQTSFSGVGSSKTSGK